MLEVIVLLLCADRARVELMLYFMLDAAESSPSLSGLTLPQPQTPRSLPMKIIHNPSCLPSRRTLPFHPTSIRTSTTPCSKTSMISLIAIINPRAPKEDIRNGDAKCRHNNTSGEAANTRQLVQMQAASHKWKETYQRLRLDSTTGSPFANTFSFPLHSGQYHIWRLLGGSFRSTQSRWNHSFSHCSRSLAPFFPLLPIPSQVWV